jgi:hypothetical protein
VVARVPAASPLECPAQGLRDSRTGHVAAGDERSDGDLLRKMATWVNEPLSSARNSGLVSSRTRKGLSWSCV